MHNLIEDVELSFRLFEFSIRSMCYAELKKFDEQVFSRDLVLKLKPENIVYPAGSFQSHEEIIKAAQMAVGSSFGATAICLDFLLESISSQSAQISTLKSLVGAVRNAFSHRVAEPAWYVKPHRIEILDLSFIQGPSVDLAALNGSIFDYAQIGGLAAWYRVKTYVLGVARNP